MDICGIEYREDPKETEIRQLMNLYPNLDWLMCRILLSYTEEQLGEFIQRSKNEPPSDVPMNLLQQSVFINGE